MILATAISDMHVASVFGDWPGLRGRSQDSVASEEQLADAWPVGGPPILWSRDLGQGYSSFAIVGDLAYTQYQSAQGQFLICLERDTGQTVWETRVGPPYELVGIYPGPRATPAVFKGVVYYTTPDGEVGAIDAVTGNLRWVHPLQQDLKGEGTEFGYSASPIVADGRLYLPIGGLNAGVVALSLPSGEIAWKSGSHSASYCSSFPITLQGHPLLVSYLQNHLVIQDRRTGHELWQTELSVGYDEHSAMPVYREPMLVVSAPFQAGSTAYQLAWSDPTQATLTVKHAWQQPKFSHDVDSATVLDATIYGFDLRDPQSKAHRPSRGEFRAVDIATGEILWSSKLLGQANSVVIGKELLLFNDAGELIRLRADRSQCAEMGRIKLFEDEVTWTPPAVSSGVAIMRSHSRAVAVRIGPTTVHDGEALVAPPRRWFPRISGLSAFLLQGEREHPFMRPEWEELLRWYVEGLGVLLLPIVWFLAVKGDDTRRRTSQLHRCLFAAAFLGWIATPVLNRLAPVAVLVHLARDFTGVVPVGDSGLARSRSRPR